MDGIELDEDDFDDVTPPDDANDLVGWRFVTARIRFRGHALGMTMAPVEPMTTENGGDALVPEKLKPAKPKAKPAKKPMRKRIVGKHKS